MTLANGHRRLPLLAVCLPGPEFIIHEDVHGRRMRPRNSIAPSHRSNFCAQAQTRPSGGGSGHQRTAFCTRRLNTFPPVFQIDHCSRVSEWTDRHAAIALSLMRMCARFSFSRTATFCLLHHLVLRALSDAGLQIFYLRSSSPALSFVLRAVEICTDCQENALSATLTA